MRFRGRLLDDAKQSQGVVMRSLLDNIDSRERDLRERADRHRVELAKLSDELGPAIAVIKGFALERNYPSTAGCRHATDADLFIKESQTWRVIDFLLERGYTVQKVRIGDYRLNRARDGFPKFYGICPVSKETDAGLIRLDLHFGAFPSCGYGLIRIDEDDIETVGGIRRPKPQRSLVILLAHIMRQGFCRLRDINDVYVLVRGWSAATIAEVRADAEANRLDRLFDNLLELVSWLYPRSTAGRASKPHGLEHVPDSARVLLFVRTVQQPKFTDGVRVLSLRYLQVDYLLRLYRSLFGTLAGVPRALAAASQLYRSGRAYGVWRRPRQIGVDERFVICPVARVVDSGCPVDLGMLLRHQGLDRRTHVRFGLVELKDIEGVELLAAGSLVLVQSSYSGHLRNKSEVKAAIERLCRVARVQARPIV